MTFEGAPMPLDDPKVLQAILTESFHPTPALQQILRDTLGKDASKHRQFSKSVSSWRWPLWGSAFEDMTTEKGSGWVKERLLGPSAHWKGSADGSGPGPIFQMVEVGLKKERSILSEGGAILKGKTGSIVVTVEPSWRSVNVMAHATEENRALAEKFYSDVDGWVSKHNFYRGQKIDASGRFLDLSGVDYDDVILPEKTKRDIFVNVKQMIERTADYEKFGIPSKRGVIMAGPPGCGKTLVARALAKNLPCTFIWANVKEIMENGFEPIYEQARELAPSVVLMEDADGFGLDRRIGGLNPRLSELLNVLDGVVENKGVITILTSNYAEMLDCALTNRPGRFDLKVFVGPPGPNEAQEILRRNLEKRKVVFEGNPGILRTIADTLTSRGASGAHVVDVVNTAMALAVERGRGQGLRLVVEEKDLGDAAVMVGDRIIQAEVEEKSLVESGLMKWGEQGPGWKFGTKEES